MRLLVLLSFVGTLASCVAAASASSNAVTFKRPVIARLWQYDHYTLADQSPTVDIKDAAAAIAGLNPSYVCSTIRLQYGLDMSAKMISDFNTLRAAAPMAKFDIQLNLTPTGKRAYPNSAAVVAHMKAINAKVSPDGWWFDFLSQAQASKPEWIAAAVSYAHSVGQTVGGNCDTSTVPPGVDAVAFVDHEEPALSLFGFGVHGAYVAAVKANVSPGTAVLGHMHCDPQQGDGSEACVFMKRWSATKRADYIKYWADQQAQKGFKFMWPVYFPLCPGDTAYNSKADKLPDSGKYRGKKTVYGYMKFLAG